MYEKFMVREKYFQNVYEKGKAVGFQLGVSITHYHGITLSLVNDFKVVIDGVPYGRENMKFTLKKKTYTLDEMKDIIDVRWDFAEVAILTVRKPGGLSAGAHEVEFTEVLDAYGHPTIATFRWTMKLQSGIRRGVTLYSYQQEYYKGEMTLEDMIAAVADLDTDGIEILTEACIPDFPNPSDMFVYRWFEFMDKYKTKPVCYDSSFDFKNFSERANGHEEAVEKLKKDILLAKRLGFDRMRAQGPFELLKACLPFAEEQGIVLGSEIHSPTVLGSRKVDEIVEYIEETGTKDLGIIPDMGIFIRNPVRICYEKHLRNGATPEIVKYVCDAYVRNQEKEKTIEEVKKMGGNSLDLFWANEAYTYVYCGPELLKNYIPYIVHIHGKFYEMTDLGTEYSIPYDEAIQVLKDNNWAGYICSEFEGQRHYHDLRYFDIDSVDQVRRHHEMMKRLIEG